MVRVQFENPLICSTKLCSNLELISASNGTGAKREIGTNLPKDTPFSASPHSHKPAFEAGVIGDYSMGTNIKPTDTKTIEGVNFSFEQDNFVILIVWQEGTQRTTQTLKLDLSDDELQQLEMVAFSERQARFFRDMRNFQTQEENPFRMPQRDEPPTWFGYEGGE